MSNITSYSFYFSIFGGAAYLLFLATSQHAMSDVNPCLDLRPIPETSYNVKFWQHGNMATWQDGKMARCNVSTPLDILFHKNVIQHNKFSIFNIVFFQLRQR